MTEDAQTKQTEHENNGDSMSTAEVSRRAMLAGIAVAGGGVALSPLIGRAEESHPPTNVAIRGDAEAGGPTLAVTLSVNGKDFPLSLEPRVTLLDALRDHVGLTGTKKGCDHGQCGACTLLVDGRRINSCLTLAVMVGGKKITTVEGLAKGDQLHPVQAAFIEHDAFQCGYCTPGQICSAVGLISEGHAASDDDIREGMSGNICRCGAYPNIVDAVRAAMNAKPMG